jgi:hypothetical protein
MCLTHAQKIPNLFFTLHLGVDRLVKKSGLKAWIVSIWLMTGAVAGFCEHGNEPSDSIQGGEFLDCISITSYERNLHGVS